MFCHLSTIPHPNMLDKLKVAICLLFALAIADGDEASVRCLNVLAESRSVPIDEPRAVQSGMLTGHNQVDVQQEKKTTVPRKGESDMPSESLPGVTGAVLALAY